jgi:hypothetical protein
MSIEPNKSGLLRKGIYAGMGLMLLAPVGVAITIAGMVGAFDTLPTADISDPGRVSEPIGEVLIPAFVGTGTGIAGLALLVICRKRLRTQEDQ